jgi:lysyl-tRNA synthetase class II
MRYLDLLWNDKSRQTLWQRSRMVRYIRDCMSVPCRREGLWADGD